MKIKSTLLVVFCLLLFACPTNDDDNNIQTAVLTETNYAYEGDLYRFALTLENDALAAQILVWEQEGEDEEGDIEGAQDRIEAISSLLLDNPTGISLGFPPRPIPPPPPLPCLCFDLFQGFNYIVAKGEVQGIVATLIDGNQEQVYSTDLSNPLNTEGLEGEFKAYNFNALQDSFIGNGTLTITRVFGENDFLSYSIPVTVNELP